MKKTITKILTAAILLTALCFSLAACGKKAITISGTYIIGDENAIASTELSFNKNKLTYTQTIDYSFSTPGASKETIVTNLTYEINKSKDKIIIYSDKSFPGVADTKGTDGRYFSEHSLEITDDYIKINNVTYNKK